MKIKKILISQPEPTDLDKSPYKRLVSEYKLDLTFYKFFEVQGISATEFRKSRIHLTDYTAVIFNSKNSVDHFFRMAKELREVIPESMKYFCSTEAVANYLQKYIQYRKRKIFAAKDSNLSSLNDLLYKNRDLKMLVPCGPDGASAQMLEFMDAKGIQYDQAHVFTTSPANLVDDIDIKKYDMIVMFSPNGVKSLQANFPDFQQGEVAFAALGSAVTTALENAGWKAQVIAPTKDYPSITDALDAFLKEYATRRR